MFLSSGEKLFPKASNRNVFFKNLFTFSKKLQLKTHRYYPTSIFLERLPRRLAWEVLVEKGAAWEVLASDRSFGLHTRLLFLNVHIYFWNKCIYFNFLKRLGETSIFVGQLTLSSLKIF